jgi:hypothetical protein
VLSAEIAIGTSSRRSSRRRAMTVISLPVATSDASSAAGVSCAKAGMAGRANSAAVAAKVARMEIRVI